MTSAFPMTISQLAHAADTSVYAVRNYASEGLLEYRKSPKMVTVSTKSRRWSASA